MKLGAWECSYMSDDGEGGVGVGSERIEYRYVPAVYLVLTSFMHIIKRGRVSFFSRDAHMGRRILVVAAFTELFVGVVVGSWACSVALLGVSGGLMCTHHVG